MVQKERQREIGDTENMKGERKDMLYNKEIKEEQEEEIKTHEDKE